MKERLTKLIKEAQERYIYAEEQAQYLMDNDVVEVRHASWKNNHCTECGMMPMGEELWDSCDFAPPKFEWFMDFCPNCGAKMKGGEN